MDALVSSALLEVAAEGVHGCSLPTLWSGLHNPAVAAGLRLDRSVKQTIWKALLNTTCLVFQVPGSSISSPISSSEPSIQAVDDAERRGLHVIGSEQLRDCYLGVYDLKHCDARLSADQRKTLERLGKARADGLTQYQLAKEFGMSGKKFFYIVRNLESRGLVVRQSSIFRGEGGKAPVATNLIHLKRFAKEMKLGSQQRFEIQKVGNVGFEHESQNSHQVQSMDVGEPSPECDAKDIRVNDDLPALKAICMRLEEAEGKVLVVSDLKVNLGYRFVRGHREWRRLLSRLKAAGLVEAFDAKVEQKVVSCIRLLKPFEPKAFSCKVNSLGTDETETDQHAKGVKRGQITEQVVELPINHQIYDKITQGGAEGVTVTEIWKCLGLNNRRNYFRLTDMIAKHGLRLEAENYKRSTLYRVRAPEHAASLDKGESSSRPQVEQTHCKSNNARTEQLTDRRHGRASELKEDSHRRPINSKQGKSGNQIVERKGGELVSNATQQIFKNVGEDDGRLNPSDASYTETDTPAEDGEVVSGFEVVPYEDGQKQEAMKGRQDMASDSVRAAGQPAASSESLPLAFSRSTQRCMALSTAHSQRDVWIMERLERERFILRAELHKWLEDMEGRKDTLLDRKTVVRNLQKLQHEGRCKCILVSIPGVTNYGRNRTTDVVLLPSVEVGPDLLSQIHDRHRAFDTQIRVQASLRSKKSTSDIPVLTGLKRMPPTDSQVVDKGGTLCENGFVSARMVRVRMLHQFLWTYISGFAEYNTDLCLPGCSLDYYNGTHGGITDSSGGIFSLVVAIQAMPLELFLQVIGSTKHMKGLAERCRRGMRLNDLPVRESEALLDINASGRLSWLVDILRRLKLLRIVMIPRSVDDKGGKIPQAAVAYALEERPYIEEPAPEPASSITGHGFNLGPLARHDFHLSTKETLEEYWKTLEYFYCGAEPRIAKRAFPGLAVPELFGPRSWTSFRVMTMDQRTELQRRIGMDDDKLTYKECVQIAQELNLTLDQVLRISYEKNQKVRLQAMHKTIEEASNPSCINIPLSARKSQNLSAKKRSPSSQALIRSVSLKILKKQRCPQQDGSSHQESASLGEQKFGYIEKPARDVSRLGEVDEDGNDSETGFINHISVVRKLRPIRKRKFCWTDALDRALVICYTKQRALVGARYNRVDWNTTQGLPAPPETCRRRIAFMKMEPMVRKALMALCNVLAARYTKHLQLQSGAELNNLGINDIGSDSQSVTGPGESFLACKSSVVSSQRFQWDDFEDPLVSTAIDEIIRCRNVCRANSLKKMAGSSHIGSRKSKHSGQFSSGLQDSNKTADLQRNTPVETRTVITSHNAIASSDVPDENLPQDVLQTVEAFGLTNEQLSSIRKNTTRMSTGSGRTRSNRVRVRKRLQRPNTLKDVSSEELVHKSVGAAVAVELIKLVFLNSSVESEVSQVLVDALRRCKESDVFAAFKFLKDKNMMAVGHDSRAFVLSPKFYENASASSFSHTTCNESLSFETWLSERKADLEQDWVALKSEQQWGELFHLFGLVSSRQLSIAPFMPDKGIGERHQDDVVRKRKRDLSRGAEDVRVVKAKSGAGCEESGFGQRRERGFPGIQVKAHLEAIPLSRMVDLDSGDENGFLPLPKEHSISSCQDLEVTGTSTSLDLVSTSYHHSLPSGSHISSGEQAFNSNSCPCSEASEETCESSQVKDDISKFPNCSLLRIVCNAISSAGEEGLRVDELAECITVGGGHDTEIGDVYAEALQSFGLARKVMAFDHVRIIASPYYERFFLHLPNSDAKPDAENIGMDHNNDDMVTVNDAEVLDVRHSIEVSNEALISGTVLQDSLPGAKKYQMITSKAKAEGRLEESADKFKELTCAFSDESEVDGVHLEQGHFGILWAGNGSSAVEMAPILPWLTADGKENVILRKALNRRVMGIVMLNPGILEESLIEQVDVLNPMSCRKLLQLLELDGHLLVRVRMEQSFASPPLLLQALIRETSDRSRPNCRRHYYVNPSSTALL